ncbi:hypothetical protein Cni_G07411 [Canna indica]|uniref:Uncharacterized protein n=1 Tax=Canna indica TaxID=4628 RepID=A0AAQ3K0B1_9LILI|nr:hypothetical protein Cni_G07411 [Canna indica]
MTNFANAGVALVQETDAESEQGNEARGLESQQPLVLPRSKSEPARWAVMRLGFRRRPLASGPVKASSADVDIGAPLRRSRPRCSSPMRPVTCR